MTKPLALEPPASVDAGTPEATLTDGEYEWLWRSADGAYLRGAANNMAWRARMRDVLQAAGFRNIRFFTPNNVAAIHAIYRENSYVFIRGSEGEAKDWLRNFQALGWATIPLEGGEEAKTHRGFTREAMDLEEAGLSEDWVGIVRIIGHSKAAAIGGVLTLLHPKRQFHLYTIGGARFAKRGWMWRLYQRPSWVAGWYGRVLERRVCHVADLVSSTPSILRSFHLGDMIQVNDDKTRELKKESEVVHHRLQWAAGKLAEIWFKSNWIAASLLTAKLLYSIVFGKGPKHLLTSYAALSSANNDKEQSP